MKQKEIDAADVTAGLLVIYGKIWPAQRMAAACSVGKHLQELPGGAGVVSDAADHRLKFGLDLLCSQARWSPS